MSSSSNRTAPSPDHDRSEPIVDQTSKIGQALTSPLLVDQHGETAEIVHDDITEPEGETEKDLLVQDVDRQSALDGVPMDVGDLADEDVAQGDARKVRRIEQGTCRSGRSSA